MPDSATTATVDVVVIGGGLAGTSTAIALARQGRSVVVVDTHAVYPPEFRAEKLGEPHVALLEKLGLMDIVRPACTPVDLIDVHRFGRLFARERRREYGFAYADLVNALRQALPVGAAMAVGRVADIATGPESQRVTLADGRSYVARLLVVATGLGDTIRRALGIARNPERRPLSLSLGFDMADPAAAFPFETLTAYGHRRADRLSYLTLFPLGATMRANLFTYHEAGHPWTKAFRQAPEAVLKAMMPELAEACCGFRIAGRVDVRPIELVTVSGERQDGAVLIGDAFRTTCPIPGNGVRRVLTDVDRLCTHASDWFATPGMTAAKLAAYFDDPVKVAMDALATRSSLYARAMVLEDGPAWTARRWRNAVVRRGMSQAAQLFGHGPQDPQTGWGDGDEAKPGSSINAVQKHAGLGFPALE